jgi:hypothetical protein
VIVLLFAVMWIPVRSEQHDSLVNLLKKEIGRKEIYERQKLHRIEGLRSRLLQANHLSRLQQFDLCNALYHEYKTFLYDSAFHYAHQLIDMSYRMNDKARIGYARVKLGFILISSGMFKETFDSLNVVDVRYLPDTCKVDYYRLLFRAYTDLNAYNNDRYFQGIYAHDGRVYLDSALRWCQPGSYFFHYLSAVRDLYDHHYEGTREHVETLMKTHALTNPQLAVNYHDLGKAYQGMNNAEMTIRCTILSTLSDIRAATKETAAAYTLAKLFYEAGDSENAYVFIRQALDDAEFYGARQRRLEISSLLPVIAAARLNSVEGQRKVWLTYSVGLTALAVLVIVFAVIIYKQLKRLKVAEARIQEANRNLRAINQRLQESDRIKEEYIGYYFGNNSEYIDKIETFRNTIDQKLQTKRVEDIRYVVNTINPTHEREELYVNFDRIFLKLFPDFVTLFNSWFETENRIVLKENQLLNTELRIFALIRLGIHDAEKIAKILGYSVNTIYSYKNRVKSKSFVPNEEFEEKVMQIKTVTFFEG